MSLCIKSIVSAASLVAAVIWLPGMAQADSSSSIAVAMNQAKIIKLSRPASTVIIGNPDIADATVENSTTIVLTGQGFGRTNLVILDATGAPIFDERIAVTRDQDVLRIYRRSLVETLSCEPFCEAAYLTEAEIASNRERERIATAARLEE